MQKEKAKPWSKATAEQRAYHRQRCIEAGKRRQSFNMVQGMAEAGKKLGIDGLQLLCFFAMVISNHKTLSQDNVDQSVNLFREKMNPVQVYENIFSEKPCYEIK